MPGGGLSTADGTTGWSEQGSGQAVGEYLQDAQSEGPAVEVCVIPQEFDAFRAEVIRRIDRRLTTVQDNYLDALERVRAPALQRAASEAGSRFGVQLLDIALGFVAPRLSSLVGGVVDEILRRIPTPPTEFLLDRAVQAAEAAPGLISGLVARGRDSVVAGITGAIREEATAFFARLREAFTEGVHAISDSLNCDDNTNEELVVILTNYSEGNIPSADTYERQIRALFDGQDMVSRFEENFGFIRGMERREAQLQIGEDGAPRPLPRSRDSIPSGEDRARLHPIVYRQAGSADGPVVVWESDTSYTLFFQQPNGAEIRGGEVLWPMREVTTLDEVWRGWRSRRSAFEEDWTARFAAAGINHLDNADARPTQRGGYPEGVPQY